MTSRPLDALLRSVLELSDADAAWVLRPDAGALTAVAAARLDGGPVGLELPWPMPAGLGLGHVVAATGQPMALSSAEHDPRYRDGLALLHGDRPGAALAVPCSGDEGLHAVLEVFQIGSASFDLDAVETVGALADTVAALVALPEPPAPPSPSALAAHLASLQHRDPGRYAALATLVALLADG